MTLSKNGAKFVPRGGAVEFVVDVPEGPLGEAVVLVEAFGMNPGHNLAVECRDDNGKSLFSVEPTEAKVRLRDGTSRDLVISLARSTHLGAFAESVRRRRRGGGHPFAYELDASKLHGVRRLRVELRRVCWQPVFVSRVFLRTTARQPTELVEHSSSLEGYVHPVSTEAGAALDVFVHSPSGRFELEVVRYGAQDATVVAKRSVEGCPQMRPRGAARLGARWERSVSITLPSSCVGGLYGARLTDSRGHAHTAPFIVRPAVPTNRVRLVIASTNTWQAYNDWGGGSFYRWSGEDSLGRQYASVISTKRPNPGADPDRGETHLARGLRALLAFLEEHGFGYDLITDHDLHANPSLLGEYRSVILDSHAEYWSAEMLGGLRDYLLRRAGAVVYLSGNGLYWKTVLGTDCLEVCKPSGVHSLSRTLGGLWSDLGSPAAALVGIGYTPAGARTWAPYRVVAPNHWALEGTGLTRGATFGAIGEFGAASGHETDKLNFDSPRVIERIAHGCNPHGGGADMIHLRHPGGGRVFSVGSIAFVGSATRDPIVAKILSNVLTRFAC